MSFEEYKDMVETELEEQLGPDYDYFVDLDEVLSDERLNEAIEDGVDPRDYAWLCFCDYVIE